MNDYVKGLLDAYQGRGLLLDSNLLLLLLVGYYNPALVGDARYKKLAKYTLQDLSILLRLASIFRVKVTTPYVLTKVSNLLGDLPEATKRECFRMFHSRLTTYTEQHTSSFILLERPEFTFLGLTDTALAELSSQYLVVSDDARMVNLLGKRGISTLNFSHLREHLYR